MTSRTIFEFVQPGMRVVLPDPQQEQAIHKILSALLAAFDEAQVALWGFQDALAQLRMERRVAQEQLQREQVTALLQQIPGLDYHEAERKVKHQLLASGVLPVELLMALPRIPALGFLSALDTIGRLLAVLEKNAALPDEVRAVAARFRNDLPQVRAIRNSMQHRDERIQGLGSNKRPFPSGSDADFLTLAFGLSGTTLFCTGGDGNIHHLEITADTLHTVHQLIQAALSALPWEGPVIYHPH